ncbi:POK11 protein, partial [Dicaeum eximium]|nr:POK11 protein [Dicaeum eximium]
RYEWLVLPQGCKNSPALCQQHVARVIMPVRKLFPDVTIYHYMDDILVCARDQSYLDAVLTKLMQVLQDAGFTISPEKVQRTSPVKYLGLQILDYDIVPQPLEIRDNPKTLRQLMSLCGSINWLRPYLGIPNSDLEPLFVLLRGDDHLNSPRQLTAEARRALQLVADAISERKASRCDPALPFQFAIIGECPRFYGFIYQWDTQLHDHHALLIIEFIFTRHTSHKTITSPVDVVAELVSKARSRLKVLAGCDLARSEFDSVYQTNSALQLALDSYSGQVSFHYPKHRMFKETFNLAPKIMQSKTPLDALNCFIDGSGKSKKSVVLWRDPDTHEWESDVTVIEGSAQICELAACVRAFKRFNNQALNLITDSAYVAGVVQRAENSVLKEIENLNLFKLLSELFKLISHRKHPFFVMHVRSYTNFPGPIAEGNALADQLAMAASISDSVLPNKFKQAEMSHDFFHQNAPALRRMFNISPSQARAIVSACPSCQSTAIPGVDKGVNPRGLNSLELRQTDVTHFQPFGNLKYVHVSVDTFSGAVFASAHSGEKTKDLKAHLLRAFATLGVPKQIKTDNGPGFKSKCFEEFCQQWGITHITGIPHNPTGQSIVERTHANIKRLLERQ